MYGIDGWCGALNEVMREILNLFNQANYKSIYMYNVQCTYIAIYIF